MTRLLSLINVGYRYAGAHAALHPCSLEIPSGICFGLLGPNGAGKTTLLKLMAGLLRPTAGHITFDQTALTQLTPAARARLIAFVPQHTHDVSPMRGRALVALGRSPHQSGLGWESPADRAAIAEAMARMRCTRFADRWLHTLSDGERQRVLIARALAQQPRLLLLDEPIAHLDPAAQRELLALLQELRDRSGVTIGMSLHDLHLAHACCTHVGLLRAGTLRAWGRTIDVATPAQLSTTFDTPILWTPALVATTGARR